MWPTWVGAALATEAVAAKRAAAAIVLSVPIIFQLPEGRPSATAVPRLAVRRCVNGWPSVEFPQLGQATDLVGLVCLLRTMTQRPTTP